MQVRTSKGRVEGLSVDGINSFLGLPFAKAPVSELRFQPPVECESWDGVFLATNYGVAPLQAKTPMFQGDSSEDSLFLNVWTPDLGEPKKPVLVWIYGGGFEGGSASTDSFSGAGLAKRGDVVVVSFNYRVGLLGFGLLSETEGFERYSNLGIRDAVAALNWVQENIENFGGDKNNVTVMGASAGGFIACSLISIPSAAGLFHKLILISGGASRILPSSQTELITRSALAELNIDDSRLKEVDAEALLSAQRKVIPHDIGVRNAKVPKALGVTLDGDIANGLLTEHPMKTISNGGANQISILSAASESEIAAFRRWVKDEDFRPKSYETLVDEVESWDIERESAEAIVKSYFSTSNGSDLSTTRERILSDWVYRLPAARLAKNLADAGGRSWALEFRGTTEKPMGHGDEAAAIFDNLAAARGIAVDPSFRDDLQEAIIRFCAEGQPGWPAYGEEATTKIMGLVSKLEQDPFKSMLDLWHGIDRP